MESKLTSPSEATRTSERISKRSMGTVQSYKQYFDGTPKHLGEYNVIKKCRKKSIIQNLKKHFDKTLEDLGESVEISHVLQQTEIADSCYETLRNICVQAVQFQKHCHRDRLTVSDLQKATNCFSLTKLKMAEDLKEIIDLENYMKEVEQYEESEKLLYSGRCLHCPNTSQLQDSAIDQSQKDYFLLIMRALFGNNHEMFSFSLSDLKRNAFVLPLLPIFIQHLCSDVVLLNYQPIQLKKILQVMRSLFLNPNLYFRNDDLYKLLNFVISCATSNLSFALGPPEESYSLQDCAAKFLSEIVTKDVQSNALYNYVLKKLEVPLKATELKLHSCYGSLATLIVIGISAVASIIPIVFLTFSEKLRQCLKDIQLNEKQVVQKHTQTNALAVHEKFLDACELLLKYYINEAMHLTQECFGLCFKFAEDIENFVIHEEVDNISLNLELCKSILEYFGDALCSRLPSLKDVSNEKVSLLNFFNDIALLLMKQVANDEK